MFKFDRKEFFEAYREHFGPLSQTLVQSLDALLDQIEKDNRFEDVTDPQTGRRQLAYCLATFKWETAQTMQPIDEHGSDAYFEKRYAAGTSVGKMLGNTQAGDGARFHGRGFVQLTGRTNYKRAGDFLKVDLIAHPEKAKDIDLAYRIATEGMIEGWFTGKKLSNFFQNGKLPQWVDARTIINGHDKAQEIATLGRQFAEILEVSMQQS